MKTWGPLTISGYNTTIFNFFSEYLSLFLVERFSCSSIIFIIWRRAYSEGKFLSMNKNELLYLFYPKKSWTHLITWSSNSYFDILFVFAWAFSGEASLCFFKYSSILRDLISSWEIKLMIGFGVFSFINLFRKLLKKNVLPIPGIPTGKNIVSEDSISFFLTAIGVIFWEINFLLFFKDCD